MRRLVCALVALGIAAPAVAAEPDGCEGFKWPIGTDRAALIAPDRARLASGDAMTPGMKAVTLGLAPLQAAALPLPPERSREGGAFAGYVTVAAPAAPSTYTLSMSSAVWIDVVQNGSYLKPKAFSGATGCEGIRKTMRFDLAAAPFTVQVSGASAPGVALLLRPGD